MPPAAAPAASTGGAVPVLLFLDVDGVINDSAAFTDAPPPQPPADAAAPLPVATAGGASAGGACAVRSAVAKDPDGMPMPMRFRPGVLGRLSDLLHSRRPSPGPPPPGGCGCAVHLRWATTWCELAPSRVAPAIGLRLPPAEGPGACPAAAAVATGRYHGCDKLGAVLAGLAVGPGGPPPVPGGAQPGGVGEAAASSPAPVAWADDYLFEQTQFGVALPFRSGFDGLAIGMPAARHWLQRRCGLRAGAGAAASEGAAGGPTLLLGCAHGALLPADVALMASFVAAPWAYRGPNCVGLPADLAAHLWRRARRSAGDSAECDGLPFPPVADPPAAAAARCEAEVLAALCGACRPAPPAGAPAATKAAAVARTFGDVDIPALGAAVAALRSMAAAGSSFQSAEAATEDGEAGALLGALKPKLLAPLRVAAWWVFYRNHRAGCPVTFPGPGRRCGWPSAGFVIGDDE